MAVELAGAKMIAPFYGNSLYVWASVLATTLGGLAAGYYIGGKLSERPVTRVTLNKIVAASAIIVALMPLIGPIIMEFTLSLSLKPGIIFSSLLLLTPPLICFGMVSPVIINLLSTDNRLAGRASGTIYAISTLGGILFTFLMGFYMIPFLGIRFSLFFTAIALAVFPILFLITVKRNVE